MKKVIFAVLALFAAPVMANEPVDLLSYGLGEMQTVSEDAGMQVRGLSSTSAAMSVGSLAGLLFNPDNGSQINFESASFNSGASEQTVGTANSSGAEAAVGATALTFDMGTFSGNVGQFALFSGGQSGAQGAFTFSLNVPSFGN